MGRKTDWKSNPKTCYAGHNLHVPNAVNWSDGYPRCRMCSIEQSRRRRKVDQADLDMQPPSNALLRSEFDRRKTERIMELSNELWRASTSWERAEIRERMAAEAAKTFC